MKSKIAWMARNHVTANLLMIFLLVGGWILGKSIKQEIFPEIELDVVTITVAYPGASPAEVEQGILLPVEDAVSGVLGIKKVTSRASEGVGVVNLTLEEGEDVDQRLQEIKTEVDRIRNFPEDAERPVIVKVKRKWHVINLVVYGDLTEFQLREQVEHIRDELLDLPEISQVDLWDPRYFEISIEVPEEDLQRYGLTLDRVAAAVRSASVDAAGGLIKEKSGEILLRVKERKDYARQYADIDVLVSEDGAALKLSDIARIRERFQDTDLKAFFDRKPASGLTIYRVGDQTPLEVSRAVREYAGEKQKELPRQARIALFDDRSELLVSRMNLLKKNGIIGLVLVLLSLTLFLETRLAFWVTLGIPVSFLGTMMLLPAYGVSINMISLFAFILALGIVVDDAIVVGENIFVHRKRKKTFMDAAVDGADEVSVPVIFTVLTTMVTFSPLFFISGVMGKFFWAVPAVVITVLGISLIEALFILPAHLSLGKRDESPFPKPTFALERLRRAISDRLEHFINGPFYRFVKRALHYRYVTLSLGVAALLLTAGFFGGGLIKFTFFPKVEAYVVRVDIELPFGSHVSRVDALQRRIVRECMQVAAELGEREGKPILEHVYSQLNSEGGGHTGRVIAILLPPEERTLTLKEFTRAWRERVGEAPGAEKLSFQYSHRHGGEDINLELSHSDETLLEQAARRVKRELGEYPGTSDIASNLKLGKKELVLKLKPEARALGITEASLGRQIRSRFYGSEALRFLRGRNEVRVMVRYPPDERDERTAIDRIRIRDASGFEIPLTDAAWIREGRGYSVINRSDRKRVINVTASVDSSTANAEEIMAGLKKTFLPTLLSDYPGMTAVFQGRAEDRRESLGSLARGFGFALFVIYALLVILFNSYFQPVIVMVSIPFGIVGAVLGHLLFGYDLSIVSMMGIVALSGIVVNDSLILIDFINRKRRSLEDPIEAVAVSACARFRAIILTSLTTFLGLSPMILETSMQARFLIPMALSLGFGVLFATGITLVLVPCLYCVLRDVKRGFGGALAPARPGADPSRGR